MSKIIVAVDGPSGTGKSSTSKLLADKLNFQYIDSGSLYRAVTYSLLQNDVKPNDIEQIQKITSELDIEFSGENIILNGIDVTDGIRSLDVTNKVSSVSKIKEIREIIVEKLRAYAEENNIVMDGRDIGTVVFPDAKYKFFLVCDLKTRAARRQQDFIDMGVKISLDKIIKELKKRDEIDMTRAVAPLKKAENAVEVDTTNMIIEEQVDCLYKRIVTSGEI